MLKKDNQMVLAPDKNDKMISAKEIVLTYKLTYQTVNHYTDFGLLPVIIKIGNVRYYDRDVVENNLKQIKTLVGEGYSLRLIRKRLIGI
ncbi:MAG: MerR family transcriptional regulator [Candidatus Omnitrophica bacterium]|nr:MerR family transcriptional regulator [Candidatus Omnitrophota bacterium]